MAIQLKTSKKVLVVRRKKTAKKASVKAPKRQPKAKPVATGGYRSMRKWTIPRIEALMLDDWAVVRAACALNPGALLTADHLVDFLRAQEGASVAWRTRGTKIGRPAKRAPKATPPAPAVVDPHAAFQRLIDAAPPKAEQTP